MTRQTNGHRVAGRNSRRTFLKATAGATVPLGSLTGYAGSVAGQQGTTVQWASDPLAKENEDAIRQGLYDAGLSQDIDFEIIAGAFETGSRQQQYQQWLNAGRPQPDLMMMDNGWTIPFIVREQLLDLSQALPENLVSTIDDQYFESFTNTARGPEGNLFGLPLFPDFATMLYRKDWVEDAGYDPEGENWAEESITWQEFTEVVSEVQDSQGVDNGFTFQADVYEGLACCTFNEFMSSWGGAYFGAHENLFGPIGDRPITVTEEPVLNAIRMIRTFIDPDQPETLDDYQGGISQRAVLQWTEQTSLQPFQNGDAVAHRNWSYAINQTGAEDAFGENLGVMPLPYAVTPDEAEYEGTGGPVSALGGWHVSVNPNTNNQDAALQVLEAMAQESFRLVLFENVGWLPPQPDLFESSDFQDVDPMGRYLPQLQTAGENAVPRPATAAWPQESTQISQEVNAALSGDKQPQQAMNDLESALQSIEESA
jgi:ABC-type glycerol-3-phosphate transport system substrate-binding protein